MRCNYRDPWSRWSETYEWIVGVLGISPETDRRAVEVLSQLIDGNSLSPMDLRRTIAGRNVVVLGAGPSLDNGLDVLTAYRHLLRGENNKLVVADTAVKPVLEHGLCPDVVVTDLDGDVDAIMEAASRGSIIMVHGHGDNIESLRRIVPELLEANARIIGTTQVEPHGSVYNFGGFTDGDRAVYMASLMGAARIIMIGMDLGCIVGRHASRKFAGNPLGYSRKLVKLMIAAKLLEDLSCSCPEPPIYGIGLSRTGCIIGADQNILPVLLRADGTI